MKKIFLLLLLSGSGALTVEAQPSLDALVDRELPQLVSTYKALHAAPELSITRQRLRRFSRNNCARWVTKSLRTLASMIGRNGNLTAWWL